MEEAWRVGDEERERTVTLLHEHASRGRLPQHGAGDRRLAAAR
jgi:Domain of unknown function (DUF1707)